MFNISIEKFLKNNEMKNIINNMQYDIFNPYKNLFFTRELTAFFLCDIRPSNLHIKNEDYECDINGDVYYNNNLIANVDKTVPIDKLYWIIGCIFISFILFTLIVSKKMINNKGLKFLCIAILIILLIICLMGFFGLIETYNTIKFKNNYIKRMNKKNE